MTMNAKSSDIEVRNTLHSLELLAKQIRSQRVETDYALRQIDKVKEMLRDLAEKTAAQKDLSRFEALYNVSRILGTSLDLQTVLDQVMDAMIQLTGAERGFLMLRDDDGNITIQAARNFDQQTLGSTELEYSRTIADMVLDNGEAVLTTNAVEDPRFKERQSIMSRSLRSIMAAPLLVRDQVVGMTYVENRVVAGLFTAEDLATMEALAGQASVAVDNALLFEETDEALSKRVDELRLLRRIDLQLNQKLDADAAMLYTLEMACRVGGADEGHLGLIENDPQEIIAEHHFKVSDSDFMIESPFYRKNIFEKVWQTIDTQKTMSFTIEGDTSGTGLLVPIIHDEQAIGILLLLHGDNHAFGDEQRDLVERIVARAAINIENGRLFEAVRAADLAKTKFVGIVAHDLKAPMTSIQGYADLLMMQGDNLTDKQHTFLSRISNTVKRMEVLVNDIADISRIEGGQLLMEEGRVETNTVIEALRDTIMPQVQERNHQFEENIADNLPDIYTDYYRLMQVLTNLLTNAYKYTPNGGTITLTAQEQGKRVHFAISDTGIGLSEEQVEMLGTPFWRADDDFTADQPGTGLGFFITRSLVQQMGSTIDIQSQVGEGSTFSFSIAVADDVPE